MARSGPSKGIRRPLVKLLQRISLKVYLYKGRGDIIILTKSGGIGSCTVQFRGYHETTGPLKESAVWVDESHLVGLGRRSLISTTFQQEDPLGLSVENAG